MRSTRYTIAPRAAHKLVMLLLVIGLFATSAYTQNFSKGQTIVTGTRPYGIKTADLNKDGKLDLVLIVNSTWLEVHLGNGDGTFASAGQVYDTSIRWSDIGKVTEFEIADVNKDGNPDLVAVGGRHLAVLKGNGNGTFQSAQLFAGSDPGPQRNLESLARGDFNKDGKTDFATANGPADLIDIFYGNGDGTFRPVRSYAVPDPAGNIERPAEVEAGDFDADGNDDLAFMECCFTRFDEFAGSNLRAWFGNGAGEFPDKRIVGQDSGEFRMKVFDINRDGKDDIVGSEDVGCTEGPPGCSGSVRTYVYSGNRSFQFHSGAELVGREQRRFPITQVAIDDFNGDGILDLASGLFDGESSFRPDAWGVFPIRADNAIDSATAYDLGESGSKQPSAIISGDFNGDKRPDIAVSLRATDEVVVYLHTGKDEDEESCFVDATVSKAKICRPLPAATVNSPVHIIIGATVNRVYKAAKIYVDGVSRSSTTFPSGGIQRWHNASLAMTPGPHRITARFWDSNDQPVSQTVNITVPGGSTSCSAPIGQVNICSPQNGSTVSSPVRVVAATGNSGNIGGNKIYVDGASRFSGSGPNIDRSITMSAGTHRITVKFWRSTGTALSKSVTITVR